MVVFKHHACDRVSHIVRRGFGDRGKRVGPCSPSLGFTLIELLVVIVLLSVLIAMILPALRGARRRGKISVCAQNLRQIGVGLGAYSVDHHGLFPPNPRENPLFVHDAFGPVTEIALLDAFDGDVRSFFCPFDPLQPDETRFPPLFSRPGGQTYNLFFSLSHPSDPNYWQWHESGNVDPDGPPLRPMSSRDVIVADSNADYGQFGITYSYHSQNNDFHEDTSRLHGDGHVETHTTLQFVVLRQQPGLLTRFEY